MYYTRNRSGSRWLDSRPVSYVNGRCDYRPAKDLQGIAADQYFVVLFIIGLSSIIVADFCAVFGHGITDSVKIRGIRRLFQNQKVRALFRLFVKGALAGELSAYSSGRFAD